MQGADRYFDLDAVRIPTTAPSGYRVVGNKAVGSHLTPRERGATRPDANEAGAPPLDTWIIPTAPYKGSHYATYPPDLCIKPILAMCPERVCVTCGEPSRRIVNDKSAFTDQPELAAHIRERRLAAGVTSGEINSWFGYKEIAKNWERTDKHGAAIPNPRDWVVLKERLGLSDDFDELVLGERRWTESTIEYETPDGERLARAPNAGRSSTVQASPWTG